MFNFTAFMKNHTFCFSTFKVSLLSFSQVFTLSNSLLNKEEATLYNLLHMTHSDVPYYIYVLLNNYFSII